MPTRGHGTPHFSWYLPMIWALYHCWSNSNLATHIMPTRGHGTYPFLLVPTYDLSPIPLLVQLKLSHTHIMSTWGHRTPHFSWYLPMMWALYHCWLSSNLATHIMPIRGHRTSPFFFWCLPMMWALYHCSSSSDLATHIMPTRGHRAPAFSFGAYLQSEPYTTVGPAQI